MQRLSGFDAGFLHMETPTMHMHTLKIAIVDPATVPGGYAFEKVKGVLANHIHLLPPFRRTVVNLPGSFHHPVWIEDRDFDLDAHLVRVAVPAPGTMRELDDLIADIAGRPLDRRRPLWQMWVVEGLADGMVAFVLKLHHAAADGVAASAMLGAIMSPDPTIADAEPPPFRGERHPGNAALLLAALLDHLRQLARLPQLVRRTYLALRALWLMRRTGEITRERPRPILDAPVVSFNGAMTPHRSFATAALPIADFKLVKEAFDVTLNDVVLAVVGGALRRYLDERGETPDRSLTCSVPVGADGPEDSPRLIGNRISSVFTTLATDLDDPVDRLRRIHLITEDAKLVQETLGKDLMESWVEYTPAPLLRSVMRIYTRHRFADRHRPAQNLVVSNVPGPREHLYIAGAKLVELFSVGPIMEGMGLNVTVWSYVDTMYFSAMACRENLPRLHDVTDGLAVALAELVELARSAPAA